MNDDLGNQVILDILADDGSLIPYRKMLNKITGSVLSTILLQQIIFLWKVFGKKRFYRFAEPCEHEKYEEGKSWCEELGFTRDEFNAAMKRIGFKMGKTKNKITKDEALVIYYKTSEQITYYELSVDVLLKKLKELKTINKNSPQKAL